MFLDILKIFNKKNGVCAAPFSQVFIDNNENIFLCPDCYMHFNAQIGNLNKNTFEEIWNGRKAQNIRTQILKKLYVFCSPSLCKEKNNFHYYTIPKSKIDYNPVQKNYPKMVSLGIDSECNVNCIMCRGEIYRCSDEEVKRVKEKIENLYLPILKDAEYLTLSTTADPFASRTTRLLMKRAAEKYPNLKFNLLTNGTLCNAFNCDDTGIINRLGSVMFSLHAATKETYDNIVKNSNFENVCKNIQWMSSLYKKGKVENFFLSFVVSTKNYFEIPKFIDFAKENGAVPLFWCCRDWGGNLSHADEDLQVWLPSHPKYDDFKNLLKSIDIKEDICFSNNILKIRNS